jgi:hypothetical protein
VRAAGEFDEARSDATGDSADHRHGRRYPEESGHLVAVIITEGAKLLDFVARSLHDLFTHH